MIRKMLALAALALLAAPALPHGGTFRGPNGGVPPGLRPPSDPVPPPPPPSDPGNPGPTDTPGEGIPQNPTLPGGDNPTPGEPTPPPSLPGQPGNRGAARTAVLTFESWRFWWAYNSDDILAPRSSRGNVVATVASPIHFGQGDDENRRDAARPTQRTMLTTVIPALRRSIERKGEHDDIQGGALIALGKMGTVSLVSLFRDAALGEGRGVRGERIEFGPQASESAALALGLLPDLTEAERVPVREALLALVRNESLRSRERAWAAVALGLQRDREAIAPLWDLLGRRYADDNIPAGILCGIGLTGDESHLGDLHAAFEKGTLCGIELNDRVRAFVGYAIAKIGSPNSLETIARVLRSRTTGRLARRSAAIAAGTCGAGADPRGREDMGTALERYLDGSGGDASGENFALIALSQIGTERAMRVLCRIALDGKAGQRSFAALGLATRLYRDERDGAGEPVLRNEIVRVLREGSGRFRDAETKAAFLLCRGLARDRSALPDMTSLAAKQGADPLVRGFCCVGLGLIGVASSEVKDALRLALDERASADLRRDAATGLGLLRDAAAVPLLLQKLREAKSFAVQAQIVTALGVIGDQTAVAPLVALLDDTTQSTAIRALAAAGLGRIGDLREDPPLARLSRDYNYRATVPDLDELLTIF